MLAECGCLRLQKRYPYRILIFLQSLCFSSLFLFFFVFILGANHVFPWLQQSGDSEETPLEGYDFEHTTADFGKLLFLASVSSHISPPYVLCSLGPADKVVEMAGKSPTADIIVGAATVGKSPEVAVTTGGTIAGVPSQEHVVSPTVHHGKETLGMIFSSCFYLVRQALCSIIFGCMNVFLLLLGT